MAFLVYSQAQRAQIQVQVQTQVPATSESSSSVSGSDSGTTGTDSGASAGAGASTGKSSSSVFKKAYDAVSMLVVNVGMMNCILLRKRKPTVSNYFALTIYVPRIVRWLFKLNVSNEYLLVMMKYPLDWILPKVLDIGTIRETMAVILERLIS
jgi:hypothetical protein